MAEHARSSNGSAWLSGINLYATAATLGLLQHFGLVHLPGELDVLGSWWVIGVAFSSHGTKAAVRAAANLSPEPFSNIALSLAEDAVAVGSSFLIAWFPVVMLGIVVLFLAAFFWLTPKFLRAMKRRLGAGAN